MEKIVKLKKNASIVKSGSTKLPRTAGRELKTGIGSDMMNLISKNG